uniref:BPTI/Kunitz inhibitor domain-containing protein n=1 Tax=Amblyomma maculatum TaxID=34609 RepID=G3MN20_AMBMU
MLPIKSGATIQRSIHLLTAFVTFMMPTCFQFVLFCVIGLFVHAWERPKECYEEPDDGGCQRPEIERWYYDPRYGYCGLFLWCGSGANTNNYGNCASCMTECTNHPEPERACKEIIGAP